MGLKVYPSDKLKELIRSLIRQEMEEVSVTGNLDGGAGPPKTPYAFAKSEDDLDNDHIEVFGYKKSKKTNKNIKKMESVESKLEKKLEQT